MADVVEKALYMVGLKAEGKDEVDALTASTSKLTDAVEKQVVTEEKITRATRTRADSADKLLGKVDDQVRNEQRLQQIREQVARFAEEGIGTEAKRAQILDAANKKYGEGEVAATGFGRVLSWLGIQHKAAGSEAESHGRSTNVVRDALHLVRPVINDVAGGLGNLGAFAGAARLGMAGLGVAITGSLIVALIEAADKSRVLKAQLDAITGGPSGAGAGLRGSADSAAVGVSTLAGAYKELLYQQDRLNSQRGIVFAPGASAAVKQIDQVTESIALAGKAGLMTEKQIEAASIAVAQSFAQNGKLTSTAFDQIVRSAEPVARAIADAFGGKDQSLGRFRDQLDRTDITFDRFATGMASQLDRLRQKNAETTGTLAQAWDRFKTEIEHTLESVAGSTGGFANRFVDGMKRLRETPSGFFDDILQGLKKIGPAAQQSFQVEMQSAVDLGLSSALSKIASWAAAAAGYIASVARGPSAAAGVFTGYGPNVGNEAMNYLGTLPMGQAPMYGGMSASDENPSYYATGVDRVIPPGYPNDTFRATMNLTSGERLIVVPPNRSVRDFLGGGSPINLGSFADGLNAVVGSGSLSDSGRPRVDAAMLPGAAALIDAVVSQTDLLAKVGITLDDTRRQITGAGNDKLPDAIKLGTTQTIAAIGLSQNSVTRAVTAGSASIVAAIAGLSASQSAAASAASGGGYSGAGFNAGVPAYFDPRGIGGAPSGLPGSVIMGVGGMPTGLLPGATIASGLAMGGGRTTGDPRDPSGFNKAAMDFYAKNPLPVAPPARPVGPNPLQAPTSNKGAQLVAPGGIGSTGNSFSVPYQSYDLPGSSGPYSGAGGDYYATGQPVDYGGMGFEGGFAEGGSFMVPPGFPNDSFVAKLNLTSGENVSVSKGNQQWNATNSRSSIVNNKTVTVIQNITNNIADFKSIGKTQEQQNFEAARSAQIAWNNA